MKKLLYPIIILLLATSCGKLSRAKAKEEIIKKYNLPKEETKAFSLSVESDIEKRVKLNFKELQDEGILTYYNDGSGFYGGMLQATLTEKGKQLVVSENYVPAFNEILPGGNNISVKVAKLEFGEITGIQEIKEINAVRVIYTLVRKDITPFGKIAFNLIEEPVSYEATFTKYDDGWRIEK